MADKVQVDIEVSSGTSAGQIQKVNKELDGLDKHAKNATKSGGGMFGMLGKVGGGFGALLGPIGLAGAGLTALGGVMVNDFVAAARESEEAGAQLQAVLTSTAGKAGVTEQAALDLADALSSKSGLSRFSDEAILSGESMLLTFTNIGSEVFPDATRTALDMSQALGQDLKTSSVQLGKALNDPIAGISALSRVGVTFTDDQKKMIEKMVEAGDTMGAQRLILKELATEFGGSAASAAQTFSGRMQTLQERMGDVAERIGTALMPMFEGLMEWLASPEVGAAIDTLANVAITGLTVAFQTLGDAGKWLFNNVLKPVWDYFQQPEVQATITGIATAIGTGLVSAFETLSSIGQTVFNTVIKPLWDYLTSSEVSAAIGTVATAIGETLGNALQFLKDHAGEVATAIGIVLIPAFTAWAISAGAAAISTIAAFAPIIAVIAGVTAAVILFKTGWDNNFMGMRDTLTEWWNNIAPILSEVGSAIGTGLVEAWNALSAAAGYVWNNVLVPIWNYLASDEVRPVLEGIATALGTVLKTAWDVVSTAASLAWNNVLKPIWDFLTSSGMGEVIGNIASAIGTTLKTAWDVVSGAAKLAWDNVLKPIWDFFTSSGVAEFIGTVANALGTTLKGAFDLLKGAAQGAWDIIQTVYNWLTGQAPQQTQEAASGVVTAMDVTLIGGLKNLQTQAFIQSQIIGKNITAGMSGAINATANIPALSAVTMTAGVMQAIAATAGTKSPSTITHAIGVNIGKGLANGISSWVGNVVAAARNLVTEGIKAAKAAAGIKSPSTVYHVMGEDSVQGYINGWWSKAPSLYETVTTIMHNTADRLRNLPDDDLQAIRDGGGLVSDTFGQAMLDAWGPMSEQILARFDETWGTAIERAQAVMEYMNNLNLYGSATGGPGVSNTTPVEGGQTHSGRAVIPMANGGSGWVDRPTLFLAGEAGREFVSFTPQSTPVIAHGGAGGGAPVVHVYIDGVPVTPRQVRALAEAVNGLHGGVR